MSATRYLRKGTSAGSSNGTGEPDETLVDFGFDARPVKAPVFLRHGDDPPSDLHVTQGQDRDDADLVLDFPHTRAVPRDLLIPDLLALQSHRPR